MIIQIIIITNTNSIVNSESVPNVALLLQLLLNPSVLQQAIAITAQINRHKLLIHLHLLIL
jgi:hypothetical protein